MTKVFPTLLAISMAQMALADAPAELIYWTEAHLKVTQQQLAADEAYFVSAYQELIEEADGLLDMDPNPVTEKSGVPPSGDMHDYLSIGPFWWPNPDSDDGMPWRARDGQVNPMARSDDTDLLRTRRYMDAVGTLTLAWELSSDKRYAEKAIELICIWHLDPDTRMNPCIAYGQGVPGQVEGRSLGIIEWVGIHQIITALQVFQRDGLLSEEMQTGMRAWFSDYIDWLIHSDLGIEEHDQPQNHGSWYDFQAVGILMYLDRHDEARERVLRARTLRIASHILNDGSQPLELRRTNSINYSCMNLDAQLKVLAMGRKLGVDNWSYQSSIGGSLPRALDFLRPYALGKKDWPHRQITPGGWQQAIDDRMRPLFVRASTIVNEPLLEMEDLQRFAPLLGAKDRLLFPPLFYFPQHNN